MELLLFVIVSIAASIIVVLGWKTLKEMMYEALGFIARATAEVFNWISGR
ncbi:hypothetical protein [Burkholderia cenocepacia]|nr:hypothetical protein [Burkholderia cenocepacia]